MEIYIWVVTYAASFVAADIALVALVRLDQLAFARHGLQLAASRFTPSL
jgi:hypothetical protein